MTYTLHQGDSREVLKTLADASVDSIVTDPPYGIRFMGQAWDGADIEASVAKRRSMPSADPSATGNGAHKSIAAEAGRYDLRPSASMAFQLWTEEWAREARRVLKPGGYLLCFASTRTYHRMTCGLEDAGFEIRDQIGWAFGSGFPKSHNGEWGGTALKPAWEPICVARKPLIGTVEANWRAHGTGALNIDACRVAVAEDDESGSWGNGSRPGGFGDVGSESGDGEPAGRRHEAGRWPANLVHDGSDEVTAIFPTTTSGMMKAGTQRAAQDEPGSVCYGTFGGDASVGDTYGDTYGDTGSAARFFYCAKASQEDREEGLSGTKKLFGMSGAAAAAAARGEHYDNGDGGVNKTTLRHNIHPTVKPTDLMRWLVRLVTPKGGLVLDPFMGSGSTGKAAVLEGLNFIGVDLSPEYIEIARARIEFAQRQGHQPSLLEAA